MHDLALPRRKQSFPTFLTVACLVLQNVSGQVSGGYAPKLTVNHTVDHQLRPCVCASLCAPGLSSCLDSSMMAICLENQYATDRLQFLFCSTLQGNIQLPQQSSMDAMEKSEIGDQIVQTVTKKFLHPSLHKDRLGNTLSQ